MAKPLLAVIVGSNRREFDQPQARPGDDQARRRQFDARIVRIDDLPMFNQDNENNLPTEVVRFKDELARADGVLIVTPEHDRSIPAVLKNAVDWGARPWGKNSWAGKPGFITGTSPGAIGSALAQQHLRSVMTGLGMILLGGEAYVTFKPNLVDDHGNIADESTRKFLQESHRPLRVSGRAADRGAGALSGVVSSHPLVPARGPNFVASWMPAYAGMSGFAYSAVIFRQLRNVSFDFDRLGAFADFSGVVGRLNPQQMVDLRAERLFDSQCEFGR